jgi:hypothetical protein
VGVGPVRLWEEAAEEIEACAETRPRGVSRPIGDELDHTLTVARFAASRAVWRRQAGGVTEERRGILKGQLERIIEEHRRLWLLRSREGGLEHSCGFYRSIEV